MIVAAIDWGNANTVVAYRMGNSEHVFEHQGSRLIPSFLCYDSDGSLLSFGSRAKDSLLTGSGHVVSGIKRLIGVGYTSRVAEWAQRVYGLSLESDGGQIKVRIGETAKTPEEIAMDFFRQLRVLLREQAHEEAGMFGRWRGVDKVDTWVVTRPAHYESSQISKLRQCVIDAGFQLADDQLISEPVAAGNLLGDGNGGPERTLVVDWGGGTLDFATIEPNGDCTHLGAQQQGCGGADMDLMMLDELVAAGQVPEDLSPSDSAVARVIVERMKEKLLGPRDPGPLSETMPLRGYGGDKRVTTSRGELLRWIRPILDEAANAVTNVLIDTNASQRGGDGKVTRCVLVGGPIESENIAAEMAKAAGRTPVLTLGEPMTAVARGALRQIKVVRNGPVPFTGSEPCPHDYGVMVDWGQHKTGIVLLSAQTPIPARSDRASGTGELELRGYPGQMISLAIWSRQASPGTTTHQYTSSIEFPILPHFDEHTHAGKICIALTVDRRGEVSAEVTDVSTNLRLNLIGVNRVIAKPLCGPPFRGFHAELSGVALLGCWSDYQRQRLFDADGLLHLLLGGRGPVPRNNPEEMQRFVEEWFEHNENIISESWEAAIRLAEQSLMLARGTEAGPNTPMAGAIQAVQIILGQRGDASRERIHALVDRLTRLYVAMVSHAGPIGIIPRIKALDVYAAGGEFSQKASQLFQILHQFDESQFPRMLVKWNEIRLALTDEEAESIFGQIIRIVQLYDHSQRIKSRMLGVGG